MARDNAISRRTAMKLTGAAAATALVAGCGGDDDDGNGGNGNGNGEDEGIEIEPGEEIMFTAQASSWLGNNPSAIEDEENPTLILTEGEEYTIGWDENDSSAAHNIVLWDDEESAVEGPTDETDEPDDDQIIEFEASSDIAEYVCEPHAGAGMRGDIEVQSGNGEANGNESEENGNESEENGNESEE